MLQVQEPQVLKELQVLKVLLELKEPQVLKVLQDQLVLKDH